MARPYKQTVVYFPHDTDASEGKTLTIIQSKYGNDGYAFWFKLLQLLGKSPGHYFDFNNPADWEYLLAKTNQKDTETTLQILGTLVLLGAIDKELYENCIIWCQKFVDGVAHAYSRAEKGVPQRPESLVNVVNNGVSVNNNNKKPTKTPYTKQILKDTILKEKGNAPAKKNYGEFNNVLLLDDEYQKLKERFNSRLPELIENLSVGIESKGYKYKSHYATILSWARRDNQKGDRNGAHQPGNQKARPRALPTKYTRPEDY